jgi:hypothetical protein
MTSPHTVPPTGTTWSRIESDFYVASSEGNFLGYVDGDGHGGFLAHDMRSQLIGTFADVPAAMLAVTEAGTAAPVEPQER